MAKRQSSKSEYPAGHGTNVGTGRGTSTDYPGKTFTTPAAKTELQDRNLLGVNPLKEQFEPTDAAPVRQKHRMAGAG